MKKMTEGWKIFWTALASSFGSLIVALISSYFIFSHQLDEKVREKLNENFSAITKDQSQARATAFNQFIVLLALIDQHPNLKTRKDLTALIDKIAKALDSEYAKTWTMEFDPTKVNCKSFMEMATKLGRENLPTQGLREAFDGCTKK